MRTTKIIKCCIDIFQLKLNKINKYNFYISFLNFNLNKTGRETTSTHKYISIHMLLCVTFQ